VPKSVTKTFDQNFLNLFIYCRFGILNGQRFTVSWKHSKRFSSFTTWQILSFLKKKLK